MSDNFTATFTVDRPAAEVFAAVNDVRSWWTGDIEGDTATTGDEFRYRYQNLHDTTQRITESIPGERVVWHVVDGRLSFLKSPGEWKGTDIVFDLAPKDGGTEVRFTHVGLRRDCECYDACSDGWSRFIGGNLRQFILTGEPQPNPFEA
ncbi:MAG: SRPBCC domain-containing protein [Hamadaea sp.]|nr:SRPBCC domain-containing protein [Hamadaea sp.]